VRTCEGLRDASFRLEDPGLSSSPETSAVLPRDFEYEETEEVFCLRFPSESPRRPRPLPRPSADRLRSRR